MSSSESSSSRLYVLIAAVAVIFFVAVLWWFLTERASWSRGEALGVALASLIDKPKTDESLVARAILDDYIETRVIASRWSAVYWGFTFVAAALSALAGLILKFESIVSSPSSRIKPLRKTSQHCSRLSRQS